MKKIKAILLFIIIIFLSNSVNAQTNRTRIQGFLSQGYLKTTNNGYFGETEDGTFQFNEMGINFTTIVTDKMHLGIQFFARDFGRFDNDRISVSWAYGDYKYKHFLGLRAGLMKLSYGLYNEVRDLDFSRPNIFYPNGVYNESWREIVSAVKGIGVYGNFKLSGIGNIQYTGQAGVINISPESAASDGLEDVLQLLNLTNRDEVTDVEVDHSYSCSIFIDSLFSVKGLKAGVSFLDLEYSSYIKGLLFPMDYTLYIEIESSIFSVEYTKNNFTFSSEYKILTNDLRFSYTPKPYRSPTLAYYGSLSYGFTDWFEIYMCYSKYYVDKHDKKGKGTRYESRGQDYRAWLEEIIFALRFDMNDNWILKLEAHINDGAASLLHLDQEGAELLENGVYRIPFNRKWELFAVKLSYNF